MDFNYGMGFNIYRVGMRLDSLHFIFLTVNLVNIRGTMFALLYSTTASSAYFLLT